MWILQNVYNNDCFALISEKRKYVVGRLDADIELFDDNSVSRSHAEFFLVPSKTEIGSFRLVIQDVGSKYGTYRNKGIQTNQRLPKNEQMSLNSTDIIRFGRLKNVWKIQYYQLNVITSTLTTAEQSEMKEVIKYLDGNLMESWSNMCTHLTINEPSITIKLLQALIEQKEVITMAYWTDLLRHVKAGKFKMLVPKNYRPNFLEHFNLNCQLGRRNLFQGLTFVFLHHKHYDIYESIVCSAGGSCKNMNAGVQKTFLLKNDVIVIQYTPSTQTQSSQTIYSITDFLQQNSKRIIPEYEIGLAILYCSIQRYCNPSYNAGGSTDFVDSENIDLVIPETTSTNTEKQVPSQNTSFTEALVEENNNIKRKHSVHLALNSSDDDANEDSCNLAKKIRSAHSPKKSTKSNVMKESLGNSVATEQLPSRTSQFLECNKVINEALDKEDNSNKKTSRKRALVPVLSDDSNDSLFDFGVKSNSHQVKENDIHSNCQTSGDTEDSNDKKATQEYIPAKKAKIAPNPSIGIEPKPLPNKVCVTNWLSRPIKPIYIKAIKCEKQSEFTTHLEGDYKPDIKAHDYDQEWEYSLANAIEIKPIITIKCSKEGANISCYKSKSNTDKSNHTDIVTKNFKTFVKKYHSPQQGVVLVHLRSHIV